MVNVNELRLTFTKATQHTCHSSISSPGDGVYLQCVVWNQWIVQFSCCNSNCRVFGVFCKYMFSIIKETLGLEDVKTTTEAFKEYQTISTQ